MSDLSKMLELASQMSAALGGEGGVVLRKLGGAYVCADSEPEKFLRYEAQATAGGHHRGSTAQEALLQVIKALSADLRPHRDRLSDHLCTADRLLAEAEEYTSE